MTSRPRLSTSLPEARRRRHRAQLTVTVVSIYGGRPYEPQIEALQKGVDVVVGTPGRLLDLAQQGHLRLGGLSMLVLDEADEMLDLGFLPDIERILRQIPDERQAMLFSATMPDPIITLARTFMKQPTHIRAEAPHSSAVHATTEQFVYRAHALDKVELVTRVLQANGRGATMVFTRTKRTAQKVADELAERGFKVGAVHGDLGQAAREKALKAFRTGDVDVLVATDVAARGIDIDDITHVINYQIPEDEQAYVHRIGRTGRAGKAGIAVTLVDWDELARWEMIDKALGLGCPIPPRRTPAHRISTKSWTSRPTPGAASANRAGRGPSARQPTSPPSGPPAIARATAGALAVARPPRIPRARPSRAHPRRTTRPPRARRHRTPAHVVVAVARARPRPAPASRGSLRRMVKPERRTKGDVVAAVVIAAVVAVVAALIWWTSDARATISRPAAAPVPNLTPAKALPGSVRQLWTAPSPKTTTPVVVSGSVVTGDGREVEGRDPATGNTLWSYARDLELCGVTYVYSYAVAVYPDVRGCGQVSTVDAKTGRRGPSRTSYADPEVRLSADGTTVLSAGDSRLEMWRSDMVRMMSYGSLDARIKPGTPPSPVCRLVSAEASSTAVSVLEACPKEADLRLTLLRPADEEDTPDLKYVPQPGVVDDSGARVIAVSDTTTAVYVPMPKPTVNIVDETGATVASSLVPTPPSPNATMSRTGDLITWWTGDSVMVFSANGLRYRYTVTASGSNRPLGPGTMMAGRLLVPVTGGYDVFDPATGNGVEHILVQRPPSSAAVVPAVAGSTILEQRGDELVALG